MPPSSLIALEAFRKTVALITGLKGYVGNPNPDLPFPRNRFMLEALTIARPRQPGRDCPIYERRSATRAYSTWPALVVTRRVNVHVYISKGSEEEASSVAIAMETGLLAHFPVELEQEIEKPAGLKDYHRIYYKTEESQAQLGDPARIILSGWLGYPLLETERPEDKPILLAARLGLDAGEEEQYGVEDG